MTASWDEAASAVGHCIWAGADRGQCGVACAALVPSLDGFGQVLEEAFSRHGK